MRANTKKIYKQLRDRAMGMTWEDLCMTAVSDDEVYGMIMDWHKDKTIITVVAFISGDASVYASHGQVVTGGGGLESVALAAEKFIEVGRSSLELAEMTHSSLPAPNGKVGFYFLTKGGRYVMEDAVEDVEHGRSFLTPLFAAANKVITAYRLSSEKN